MDDSLVMKQLLDLELHTTLNVPTRTSDGALLLDTISDIKFAAIPIMPMRDMAWSILQSLKVAPRAP